MESARRYLLVVAACALAAAGLLTGGAGRARAGAWTLISCTQPDGQPAPTDGWSTGNWAGSGAPNSGDVNTCGTPGGALTAESSAAGQPASYTGPEWIFTAPPGATIAGGSITASLTSPQGQAWIGTPGPAYDGADVIVNCQLNAPCGTDGTQSGTFPITHPGGTMIYAPALCVDFSSPTCPQTGPTANASVAITQAQIELSQTAIPEAANPSGTLLSHHASGTADLVFTASDPGVDGGTGPGVYGVEVQIDGRTVYSGVPDSNGGACAALGTDPATLGLEFDHAQPCAPVASVRIPVRTRALSDARHHLTVTVSDAAGDVATVLDRSITTFNPRLTPRPRRAGEVRTRLVVGWRYVRTRTRLTILARALPRHGSVTIACVGRACPRLRRSSAPAAGVGRLWHELASATFRAGDRLQVTIRAPHRRAEPIELRIRAGRRPTARLLRSP